MMVSLPIANATILQIFCLGGVICLLGLSIQRIYFHKLSKFPGPWLNAVSPLPHCISLFRGRQHAYYRKLHDKYGPVIRAAPNEISFCAGTAWEDVYSVKLNLPKAPVAVGSLRTPSGAVSMIAADQVNHARMRKAWAFPFSNTALLSQEPLITKHIDRFIAHLHRFARSQTPINMPEWYTFLTFDIIGELAFAEPFGCLEGAGAGTVWSTSVSRLGIVSVYEQATRRIVGHGWLQKMLLKLASPRKAMQWRHTHFSNTTEKTMARVNDSGREHEDFLYYILRTPEAKRLLSEDELIVNSSLMIGAGSDTTALMLSGWTNFILRNRSAYDKLVKEIRTTFKSEDEITWSLVKDLPYLGAVINETMRLFPPVPANLTRVTPQGGCTIDGHFIPGDTLVGVASWSAVHSPLNFKDPEKFIPERWMSTETGPYSSDNRAASQPFSMGPRGCLGKNVSYIEQRLIICRLLCNFDLDFDGGEAANWLWDSEGDFKHMKAYAVWMKPKMSVRLTEVKR